MISIDRGSEPPELAVVRENRLARAVDAFNAEGPGSKALSDALVGYDVVKKDLYRRQHKKCAYCERMPGFDGQPVEHFRPKKLAIRKTAPALEKDHERYWWLTWTWSNLLFACTTCNGPARKGNHFPLEQGSPRLPSPARPAAWTLPPACLQTSVELPLLLDPSCGVVDPLDHLRWLPVDRTQARSLWTWELRGLTKHGRETKTRLGLGALADDIDSRYRETVWPRFRQEIEQRTGKTGSKQLLAAWDKLARDLVDRRAPFTAATWSMLDVLRTSTKALERLGLPAPPRP